MSLSPRGATAVVTGNPSKGWAILLVGGVLAWISGQSWSVGRGFGEPFQMVMAYGTLVAVAIPATLVAGKTSIPWVLAAAGMIGMTVPWFFDLAVEFQGQGIWGDAALIMVTSWLVSWATCWLTRAVVRRADRPPR